MTSEITTSDLRETHYCEHNPIEHRLDLHENT